MHNGTTYYSSLSCFNSPQVSTIYICTILIIIIIIVHLNLSKKNSISYGFEDNCQFKFPRSLKGHVT